MRRQKTFLAVVAARKYDLWQNKRNSGTKRIKRVLQELVQGLERTMNIEYLISQSDFANTFFGDKE